MCCRKTATLLMLTTNMVKQLQAQRFVNPSSEMPSFLVKLFSGVKHYCSKDKAYSIFFPRQMQSNRDFLKHIIACLRHLEPGLPQSLCYSEEK